jgi:radical SAM-linked protein
MAHRVPDREQAPAPVQRLRLRYAKRGRLRFTSARDFQRALERALRRAGVPMAYSSGFHPHPRISYANAAPTGVASEAEYVEIALAERVDPERLRLALDDALPEGLDIVAAAPASRVPLADLLEASVWRLAFGGVSVEDLRAAGEGFLALDRAEVTRVVKSGPRTFDVRSAVVSLDAVAAAERGCAILVLVVRHTTPAVRPDDILTALARGSLLSWPTPPLVTRLAQGTLVPAGVADPFEADQDAVGA